VEGAFERGDSVDIASPSGVRGARGIVNYDAGDVRKIARRRSADIEPPLGYSYGDHVVHRDNLVCFQAEDARAEPLSGS
jgi:glutamate 5-kinase